MTLSKLLTSLTFSAVGTVGTIYCIEQIPMEEELKNYLQLGVMTLGGITAILSVRNYLTSDENTSNSIPSSRTQNYKETQKEGTDRRGNPYKIIKKRKW